MVVHTGDVRGAGTDANVILTLYGEKGKSDEFKLRNKTDNFERAKVDKFKVSSLDFTEGLYSRFNVTVTPSYELGWEYIHVKLISSV